MIQSKEGLMKMAHEDPRTIIQAGFWVVNKDKETVPFIFNEPQNIFYKEMTYRDDLVKAGQLGISTEILAILTVKFLLIPNAWAVCISHEEEATKRLFEKVDFYLNHLPPWLKTFYIPGKTTEGDITNEVMHSKFYIGTAGARAFGRGDTPHYVHMCLTKNNEIIMKDGFTKQIDKIKIGDEIINGKGGFSKVKNIWINDPKKLGHSNLLSIKSYGNYLPIECTPDHKILTTIKLQKGYRKRNLIWKEAGDLTVEDYIAYPIVNPSKRRKTLNLSQVTFGKRKKSQSVFNKIPVDKNLGLLVGWYLAEGSISKNGSQITLAIHKDELKQLINLLDSFKGYFTSVKVKSIKNSKTTVIHIYGTEFTRMILMIAGRTENKHISSRFWKWGRDFIDGLVVGLFEGDGCFTNKNAVTFCNTRKQLVYQLKSLLLSIRIGYPSIYFQAGAKRNGRLEKDQWRIYLFGVANQKFRKYYGYKTSKTLRRRSWKPGKKYFWSKIKSIDKIPLSEKVYDIEIDDDCHSFLTTSGVVHNSESSRWKEHGRIMTGLIRAVPLNDPHTWIVKETTANGQGTMHHLEYQRAKRGDSEFVAHFLPWFSNPDYRIENTGLKIEDITEEEKRLTMRFPKLESEKNKGYVDLAAIEWYRKMERSLVSEEGRNPHDMMKQEFPSDDVEAFLFSGNPVFPVNEVEKYKASAPDPVFVGNLEGIVPNVSLSETEKGWLKIWRKPMAGSQYIIFADIAESDDYCSAHVLAKRSWKIVAHFHARIESHLMGTKLNELGHYYNDAEVVIEINNMGQSTIDRLRDLSYPHLYMRETLNEKEKKVTKQFGWRTDLKTKPLIIGHMQNLVRTSQLPYLDFETAQELSTYVLNEDGSMGASEGNYDDRVISVSGAYYILKLHPFRVSVQSVQNKTSPAARYRALRTRKIGSRSR